MTQECLWTTVFQILSPKGPINHCNTSENDNIFLTSKTMYESQLFELHPNKHNWQKPSCDYNKIQERLMKSSSK